MPRPTGLALAALTLITSAPARADVYVTDPLTADTFTGRGARGGTFSASGWTTTADPANPVQDSIWYEIADALPIGSVEYTVVGLAVGTTLSGSDHDILTIYQAPTGQAEPVDYSPYFRNNDFKMMTRIFGSLEVGRPGAMKVELAFCPRGEPWYHDEACTPECDRGAIGYAGGTPSDVGWDAATEYRMRLEWGNGTMKYYRNGTELGSVTYPGTYAPQPMRVRIGSPRHGTYPGETFLPPGLTFKDVAIEGTPGSRTPICGSVEPDAGADAGPPPVDAGGAETEYLALQDVTGASWESGVFPDANDLNVEGAADGTPGAVVYLRFPALTKSVQRAVLRLHSGASSSSAGGSGVVCSVSDDTWSETTLTWASRPAVSSTCTGAPHAVDPDSEIEWDVTALVAGATGNHNLAIVSSDPDGAHYLSKESGGTSQGPRLFIVEGAGPADSGSGSGGSGTQGSGGGGTVGTGGSAGSGWGAMAGAGGSPDAGSSGGNPGTPSRGDASEADSGCGCRLAGDGPGRLLPWLGAGAALVLLARSRRRRRSA